MNTTSLSYCLGYTTGLALLKAQAKMLDDSALVAELIINLVTMVRWAIDTAKIDTDATKSDEIAAVQTALPYTKVAGLLPAAPEPARPALIPPAPVNPQIAEIEPLIHELLTSIADTDATAAADMQSACIESLGIRELRKLARGKVPKASKLSKAQLVAALT